VPLRGLGAVGDSEIAAPRIAATPLPASVHGHAAGIPAGEKRPDQPGCHECTPPPLA